MLCIVIGQDQHVRHTAAAATNQQRRLSTHISQSQRSIQLAPLLSSMR